MKNLAICCRLTQRRVDNKDAITFGNGFDGGAHAVAFRVEVRIAGAPEQISEGAPLRTSDVYT